MYVGVTKGVSVKTLLFWIWKNSCGARRQMMLSTIIGMTNVACQLLWVLACKYAIDIATGNAIGSIAITGCIIGLIMLAEIVLRGCNRWISSIQGVKAANNIRLRIFSRLMRSEWQYMQKHHSGDLINRLEGDVNNITSLIIGAIPAVVVLIVQLAGSFVLLFEMNDMLAISIVFILPVCMLVSRLYVTRMRHFNREVRDSDSRIQSALQESLQHKTIIKTLEQNESTEEHLNNLQSELHGKVRKRTKFSIGAYSFIQLGFAIGYLTAFLWGVHGLAAGVTTFGTLSAFLQLVGLIQRPTIDLSRYIPETASALTAAERLKEIEELPKETEGDKIVLAGACGVRFNGVTFGYDGDEHDVFDNFSFDFEPGTTTAVVGGTGTGKTTLIRLMVALVHPRSGNVEIYNDGGGCESSPLTRSNFVYTPQGNSLISGTIRDNLIMGNRQATDKMIQDALYAACAEFVFNLPSGMDTQVSELGGGLSEGQAQRIAIARSLLRPGNILILDEVTSALDNDTEKELLHRLTTQKSDKTLIFVTHRTAVLDYCDKVLDINNNI